MKEDRQEALEEETDGLAKVLVVKHRKALTFTPGSGSRQLTLTRLRWKAQGILFWEVK